MRAVGMTIISLVHLRHITNIRAGNFSSVLEFWRWLMCVRRAHLYAMVGWRYSLSNRALHPRHDGRNASGFDDGVMLWCFAGINRMLWP